MNLIRAQFSDYGFHPVWFNAWHHEQKSHLLAALLQNIREQAIPPVFAWHGFFYRLELARQRYRRRWVYVAVLLLAAMLLFGFAMRGGNIELGDANSLLTKALSLLPFALARAAAVTRRVRSRSRQACARLRHWRESLGRTRSNKLPVPLRCRIQGVMRALKPKANGRLYR